MQSAGSLCAYLKNGLSWSVGTNALTILSSTSKEAAKPHLNLTGHSSDESTYGTLSNVAYAKKSDLWNSTSSVTYPQEPVACVGQSSMAFRQSTETKGHSGKQTCPFLFPDSEYQPPFPPIFSSTATLSNASTCHRICHLQGVLSESL